MGSDDAQTMTATRLRCMRCGVWTMVDASDPWGPGICGDCFRKYVALGQTSDLVRFVARYHRPGWERHPTARALMAISERMKDDFGGDINAS